MGGANARGCLASQVQELGAISVPTSCAISNVNSRLDEGGNFNEPGSKDSLATVKFLEKTITHTAWYANAIKAYRETFGELP